jgi:hypothetical protein
MDEEVTAIPTDNLPEEILAPELPVITDGPVVLPAPEPVITKPVIVELPPDPSTLTPIPAPNPEPQVPEPEVQAPTPEPVPEPAPAPIPPATPITNHISPVTIEPFDISSLSDADLKAAAALYTKRNQAEISRKGVAKRKETMELNLREITDYLSLNNGSPLPRIAKHTNITPGTTSKYLRQLIANDKVRADGWGKTRRYYLK